MRKTIFLTGATGTMGFEGLKQILSKKEKFNLKILVRPTKRNKKKLKPFEDKLTIIWGDLNNYEDIIKGVNGSDYILHIAAMIPPVADHRPEIAHKVNVEVTKNIIKAIKEQPNKDNIKFVYIGSVAETGDRLPPVHWGRVGDPLKPSTYDYYAITKINAEREVIESGLKYWVSLRQTGILHFDFLNVKDGILFHQPIMNCLEWVTAHDSGILLANLCVDNLEDSFWNKVYNIGGGKGFRLTYYEFLDKIYKTMGVKDFRKYYDLKWFALYNFHGQWYQDSDNLNNYLHFRTQSLSDYLIEFKKRLKLKHKLLKFIPPFIVKNYIMKRMAIQKSGNLYWISNNIKPRIKAFYGTKLAFNKIPSWKEFCYKRPADFALNLDHGYDESINIDDLDINDMIKAAKFRGGKLLSKNYKKGNIFKKLQWQCAFGHRFYGSPYLILKAGHWCPHCQSDNFNYEKQAKKNLFFAQIWKPIHFRK